MPSSSSDTSESTGAINSFGRKTLALPPNRSWTLAFPPADHELRPVDCWIHGDPRLKVFCH
jgi:hypothetical protein